MKRLFAAVLLLCLLLTMTLPVYAAPEEEEPTADETVEENPEETPEEIPETEAKPEEETLTVASNFLDSKSE